MPWLLVVEDHDDGRELLSLLFAHRGFDVEAVDSAHAALARIEERGDPAVVVTDIRMNQIDGIELAHRLRARAPTLRILALTGVHRLDAPVGLFDQIIKKPIDPNELVDLVTSVWPAG